MTIKANEFFCSRHHEDGILQVYDATKSNTAARSHKEHAYTHIEIDAHSPGNVVSPLRKDVRSHQGYVDQRRNDAHLSQIIYHYRMAKAAEKARIRIDQGLLAFIRTYLVGWNPTQKAPTREQGKKAAQRVLNTVRKNKEPKPGDESACEIVRALIASTEVARAAFEIEVKQHKKKARELASALPAYAALANIKGFSAWGLVTIIGEAGDLGNYSGARKLYKRLGLAPDECYPRGEKSNGRKIPRSARGRIIGILFDPLIKHQWAAEKEDVPAHAVGPFGRVYGEAKARALMRGKTNGHAFSLARRTMIKALLHDVYNAWHGKPLDFSI